jgi:hypothetical protein
MSEFTQELALFDVTSPSSRAAMTSSSSGNQEHDQNAAPPATERKSAYTDFSVNAKMMAESIELDIQLADPETELRLMQELDHFSTLDIADLAALLRARRDSLTTDLDCLRELHVQLRRQADLD